MCIYQTNHLKKAIKANFGGNTLTQFKNVIDDRTVYFKAWSD